MWDVEQIYALQDQKLRRLITHAYENVPYYKKVFENSKLRPKDIISKKDIAKIPVLTKNVIREAGISNMIAHGWQRHLIPNSSSGATGEPLQFYIDKNTKSWATAAQYREWHHAGYRFGDKIFTLWGNPLSIKETKSLKKKLSYWLRKDTLFPAFKLDNKASLLSCVDKMQKVAPQIIYGYPQAIYIIAEFLKANNIVLNFTPKAVITTGENLLQFQRHVIETQFNTKVYDQYGCGEVMSIAFQRNSDNYRIIDEHVIVEITNNRGEPLGLNRLGLITVTDLDNYGMPFIRYQNGDLGILTYDDKIKRIVLKRIVGRTTELILTPTNRILVPLAFISIYRKVKGIRRFQIVQDDLHTITIKLVKSNGFTQLEFNKIVNFNKTYIEKHGISVNYIFVDRIEVDPTGKYSLFKSKISTDKLLRALFKED